MIGIGYTTRNRRETALKAISECKKFLPKGAKFVVIDDGSDVPFPDADFRFVTNAGISRAKNKALELLVGCDHIFLFDDDCWPIVKGWELPYIESGENHLSFTFNKLINGRSNGNEVINDNKKIAFYQNPCGCMLYFTRGCIDSVGGFDVGYKIYGYEHVDLSRRINNAGLTDHKFMDVSGSLILFHSEDYYSNVSSSVPKAYRFFRDENKKLFDQNKDFSGFMPYKYNPENAVLSAYFNYSEDGQRGVIWDADIKQLWPLINSCQKNYCRLVIFHNGLIDPPNYEGVEFVKVSPGNYSPNVYRWFCFLDYLKSNPFGKVFMTDSTDVEMLRNPFNDMQSGLIYSGYEEKETDNNWMKSKQEPLLTIPDYRQVIESVKEPLLNCGLVGGSYGIVLSVLEKWTSIHNEFTNGILKSTDMSVYNYTLRKHFSNIINFGDHINTKFKQYETENKTAWFKHK